MSAALSYLAVQHDWHEVVREENGSVWITCKTPGGPGLHGTIKSTKTEDGRWKAVGSEGFRVGDVSQYSMEVFHIDPNCSTKFIAPQSTFKDIHDKSIKCLDVTPNGLAVSACMQNKLHVWETSTGLKRRTLEGHLGDVYTCRFFPSGIVVLSGGADMMLKIWSAETGDCPVSMKGHKGAILDTAIVDRGRNVISVSKDGTAKLWDCGQSACLSTLYGGVGDINGCSLGVSDNSINLGPSAQISEREVATEGKMLLLACEDKNVRGVGVTSRREVLKFSCPSPVNCVSFLSEALFTCGCQDGLLYLVDARNTRVALSTWQDSQASITSLLPFKDGFIASKNDGMCSFYSLGPGTKFQVTGPDCDPVYKVVCDGANIFTCSRDHVIRKYSAALASNI